MKRICRRCWWVLIVLMLTPSVLSASEGTGSLSVFAFSEGRPLANIEIVIDGKSAYRTDSDGSRKIILTVGRHQVQVVGKSEDGQNLGYVKSPVEIKNGRDTLFAARFVSDDDDLIMIDTPLEGRETVKKKTFKKGKAYLHGTILSSETNRPIRNARVFVKGTSVDARTNEDGYFMVEVPAHIPITISLVHSEYASHTLTDIYLLKNEHVSKEFKLAPASMELEEYVVLAPEVKGSIASIVVEEKEAHSISNILGAEEFGKKGDSSAASALKRVTGVTLIDGEDVYVRGLGERYANIEMNSMPLPSPNPLQRAVPLDIFPAGAISSMKVQKSATADIPSNFGGGYINIRTKESSKKTDDYLKLSVEAKANTNTGDDFYTYEGSDTDVFGFDDGYREIDADIREKSRVSVGERVTGFTRDNFTDEELSQFTQDYVDRDYNVEKEEQPFGGGFGIEGAKAAELADTHHLTFFGKYGYETDSESRTETYNRYDMEKSTGKLYQDPTQTGTIDRSLTGYEHNALLNIGYNHADVFKLKYTKLFTHNAEDVTRVVDGIMGSNDEDMTKYYLDWEERTLNVDQINGAFDYALFGNESNFRYGIEKATAELYQPNNFQYTFRNEGEPFLDNKISNSIAKNLESDDDLTAFYVKNKFNFDLLSEADYIDIGLSMSSKERESRQNKFFLQKQGAGTIVDDSKFTGTIEEIYDEYVRADIPYDERSLVVNQLFSPADHYDAEVEETNFYINTFFKPGEKVEVLLGARAVDFSQTIYQFVEDRDNPDMSKRRLITRVPEELAVNEIFPSIGVKYLFNKDNIVDIAASKTYIAPDLREFTSGEYFHPYEVATILGNPGLVNTEVYSFDLKYGHYFSDTQNIKFGLFYKHLDKPIEDVMIPSSSLPVYGFDNADKAVLYGLEIDGRKSFSFISESLKNYYISGNVSFTESEVTLTGEQETIYSTNDRELQGLSPVVVNVTLGYDTKRRSVTLSYNKMGERIRKVGMIDDGDFYPDHYEDPAATLDFVWIEAFRNGIEVKGEIGNILQEETIWTQGARVTQKYEEPMTFSLGLSYKW
ncbi:MAG: carboxypeptidase-like regulatory domain-containing protein [Desulfobacterales bacterium]|nr:carboxypeptidase-like regulatory domain-containing protein [Desulfobacterales bacterium]